MIEQERLKNNIPLTAESAKTAWTVKHIEHPEWGNFRFQHNAQRLNDGTACAVIGTGFDSRVLFEEEYCLWEVTIIWREAA